MISISLGDGKRQEGILTVIPIRVRTGTQNDLTPSRKSERKAERVMNVLILNPLLETSALFQKNHSF